MPQVSSYPDRTLTRILGHDVSNNVGLITINGETITANKPVLDLSQTWNNAGVTFTGLKLNISNTASSASSLVTDIQFGSTSVFKIGKEANVAIGLDAPLTAGGSPMGFTLAVDGTTHWVSTIDVYGNHAGPSTTWWRKTRGATAQAHALLNASDQICVLSFQGSDGTNYHEAVSIDIWTDGTPANDFMPGRLDIVTNPGTEGSLIRTTWDSKGNVILGSGVHPLATTATDGFLYLTASSGPPTGTPSSFADRVPLAVDQTNDDLYIYSNGAWVQMNGGTGSPGGATLTIQYNNASSFAGMSGTSWDNTNRSLTMTGATVTTSNPILNLSQTWNDVGVVFTALKLDVTNSASAATSLLMDLQVGGSPKFKVRYDGALFLGNSLILGSDDTIYINATTQSLSFNASVDGINPTLSWSNWVSSAGGIIIRAAAPVQLDTDATNILAQRRTTNAQTSRIYDTYVSATDYHRLAISTARATLSNVSGATVTATGLIPDGAVVIGVTSKVTTTLGTGNGTTGYTIGDGSDADRWGAVTGTASGTSSDNTNWTAGTIQAFIAATDVVVTATGGNFDGTGVIYLSVQYLIGQCD